MSNLISYKHNSNAYLTDAFADFKANQGKARQVFNIDSPTIELSVSCNVGIFPSSTNTEVVVEIDTDEETLKTFSVQQRGKSVVINQESGGSNSNIFIGDAIFGNNVSMSGVSIGGNSTVVVNGKKIETRNGKTYVNGVCIDGIGEDSSNKSQYKEPRIRILVPAMSSLEAELSGDLSLASVVPFKDADVEIQGSAAIALASASLNLDINGSGKAFVFVGGDSLNIDISGSGIADVMGKYNNAKISVSGSGKIYTQGYCTGDYKASISGTGNITNTGKVDGKIKKSVSGTGSINA